MKLKIFLAAVLCGLAALADETIGCTLRLADGSTIKGELITESFAGEALFAPDLALPARVVKAIAFDHKKGTCAVELTNGDRLTMVPATESFRVRSLLGEFDIPRTNIQSLALRVLRTAGASGAEEGLVYGCTFDSEEAIVNPAVGPGGKYQGGSFVDGKTGKALAVSAYQPGMSAELPIGIVGERGCFEFWAKIESTKANFVDGGDPYFFDCYSGDEFFHLEFNANNGGGNSGLCGGMPGAIFTTARGFNWQMPYESVLPAGTTHAWHHYAVVWDADGIDVNGAKVYAAILLDGTFVSRIHNPQFVSLPNAAMAKNPERAFTLSIPAMPTRIKTHSKSPVAIDEFKLWNYPKTMFELE